MKRSFIASLLMMLCVIPMLADEPQGDIKFEKVVHDFGKIDAKSPVASCTFTFTNVGDAPLTITQCTASCGCTVPQYPEKPVAPGQKGTIKVTYNGKGRMAGNFKKIIQVATNGKTRIVRLCIQGEMVEGK